MKTFWIGTGTRRVLNEEATGVVATEDVGIEVEADNLTIEPSGALTLWRSPDGQQRSALVMAFAPGHWTKAHLVAATVTPT